MEVKEIIQYVKNHASGKVKIAITDIDGVLRGKYISVEKFLSVVDSNTSFCDVIFGWDSGDAACDNVAYRISGCAFPAGSVQLPENSLGK